MLFLLLFPVGVLLPQGSNLLLVFGISPQPFYVAFAVVFKKKGSKAYARRCWRHGDVGGLCIFFLRLSVKNPRPSKLLKVAADKG